MLCVCCIGFARVPRLELSCLSKMSLCRRCDSHGRKSHTTRAATSHKEYDTRRCSPHICPGYPRRFMPERFKNDANLAGEHPHRIMRMCVNSRCSPLVIQNRITRVCRAMYANGARMRSSDRPQMVSLYLHHYMLWCARRLN